MEAIPLRQHFKIRTDHVSLKYLLNQKIVTHMQHQWLIFKLMGYDYEIGYRKGKDNMEVDALSRTSSQLLYSLVVSSVSTKLMEEIA